MHRGSERASTQTRVQEASECVHPHAWVMRDSMARRTSMHVSSLPRRVRTVGAAVKRSGCECGAVRSFVCHQLFLRKCATGLLMGPDSEGRRLTRVKSVALLIPAPSPSSAPLPSLRHAFLAGPFAPVFAVGCACGDAARIARHSSRGAQHRTPAAGEPARAAAALGQARATDS